MTPRTLLYVLLIGLLPACAGMQAMKTDINDLKGDSYETKKELKEMKAALDAVTGEMGRLKAQAEKPVETDALGAIKDSQAELYARISGQESDVKDLRGKIEETAHSLEILRGEALKTDKPQSEARLDGLDKSVKELGERLSALETAMKESAVTPEKAYEEAYGLYTEKKYIDSREKFLRFLKRFPEHKLAGNARFWIAETYYAEKDFENAILAYEEMLKTYKDSPKAPAAMLKQALAFLETGDKRAARSILRELLEKHPDSEQAGPAKKKLEELK